MNVALSKMQNYLNTIRFQGNLKFDRRCLSTHVVEQTCKQFEPAMCYLSRQLSNVAVPIPASFLSEQQECPNDPNVCNTLPGGNGVDTDYLVYITAESDPAICDASTQFSHAATCYKAKLNNKPIAGVINYCISKFSGDEPDIVFQNDILHNLFHMLGFSNSLYAWWPEIPYRASFEGGNGLESPNVLHAAQEHFGCATVDHVLLEDAEPYPASHFDARIAYDDLMTSKPNSLTAKVTRLSLAVMEDTGWFTANYFEADFQPFGFKKGCDFLDETSCTNLVQNYPDHFCDSSQQTETACSIDSLQQGYCEFDPNVGCDLWIGDSNHFCKDRCGSCECVGESNGESLDNCLPIVCRSDRTFDVINPFTGASHECSDANEGTEFFIGEDVGNPSCPNFDKVCGSRCDEEQCENPTYVPPDGPTAVAFRRPSIINEVKGTLVELSKGEFELEPELSGTAYKADGRLVLKIPIKFRSIVVDANLVIWTRTYGLDTYRMLVLNHQTSQFDKILDLPARTEERQLAFPGDYRDYISTQGGVVRVKFLSVGAGTCPTYLYISDIRLQFTYLEDELV
eukprot:TRINITY_DN1225_c0_g1_i2.p1 TRINITY_DN1225_c0_g1~~TRINITY_DN1225_c0_g1_i2.p1  ORF type:complete len:662 (+),score=59.49 TRINITY_DN1225_c0_g1_i2:281-1987(+)